MLRVRRQDRGYPLLAGDVARSWACILVFLPSILVISLVAFRSGVPTADLGLVTYLATWSVFSALYIAMVLGVFVRADATTLARWLRATPRPRTRRQQIWWAVNGHGAIWWALSGGIVSLSSVTTLVTRGESTGAAVLWSGVVSLAASWLLIAVSFAVHYAGQYARAGGLDFPGDEPPVFTDFLYVSLQLSTTFAGSDVSMTTSSMRRSASLHGLIAFLFNTVIIAILVTVLISAIA